MEIASEYKKMDQLEHILDRPDMYIGDVELSYSDEYLLEDDFKIRKKTIVISPGLLRIFLEPLANAVDNIARSRTAGILPTEIRVDIDEHGVTTIYNDGRCIPVEIHPVEKCYNHTMIFGMMLTGSNYDDTKDRLDISGRNGVGVKTTNVFSKYFRVETGDPERGKYFSQTWRDNTKIREDPIVTDSAEKIGYTRITFFPDFTRFKFENYSDDILKLVKRYLVDIAMLTKLRIYFNNVLIPVSTLQEYSKLYNLTTEENPMLYVKTKDCEVLLTQSNEFQAISFVNGIFTPLGGTHVNPWVEGFLRPLVEKLNKKDKPSVNIGDVKQFFRIFVNASLVRPKWKEQSKLTLTFPTVEPEIKKTHITTITKWPVMDYLQDMVRNKEMNVLKKLERKTRGYTKVEGLEPANFEGKEGCILAITEGDSAKTYVVAGINQGAFGKVGRDWFGIYPIRGKLLNTRNSTATSIADNKVIKGIIQALGLKKDVDYRLDSEFKKLRYTTLMIVTDADVDGYHITGLITNFFHSLYPSLLQREKPFITFMQTPIVRVYLNASKTDSIVFYDENEYRKYLREGGKCVDHKYYKGLGTSTKQDVKESFGRKMVEFVTDEETNNTMIKVFHKKYADMRKEWLENFDPDKNVLKWAGTQPETKRISVSDFLDFEMIRFSYEDCKRSIPSLMDGLKESHRKVLYTMLERKTKKELKVEQLSGLVSLKTCYHHGEQNLHGTIVGMAQSFVGSNNIPLLKDEGQFGTRRDGGADHASARYIYTALWDITRKIFRKEDDALLTLREDDGDKVEPYYYIPILPMILVNGMTCAIGTGWSSKIPCYNPVDIVNAIKVWLQHDGKVFIADEKDPNSMLSLFPDLHPWYRGFTGTIQPTNDPTKYLTWGTASIVGTDVVVEELPIGTWTLKYNDMLETWREEKKIDDLENQSGITKIYFRITPNNTFQLDMESLKLSTILRTTNMCLFTEEEQLKKYSTVDEIIDAFCSVRYGYYVARKKLQIQSIEDNIKYMGNMKRFLIEVREGTIKLFDEKDGKKISRKILDIESELQEKKYDKKVDKKTDRKKDNEEEEEEEEEEPQGSYNYLLRMQIRSITEEKINKLQKDIDNLLAELEKIKSISEKEMWIRDLDDFLESYQEFEEILKVRDEELESEKERGDSKKKKTTRRRK